MECSLKKSDGKFYEKLCSRFINNLLDQSPMLISEEISEVISQVISGGFFGGELVFYGRTVR